MSGRTPRALAASMEAHLLRCARCRQILAGIAGDGEGDNAWARLADSIDRPTPTPLARLTRGHWFAAVRDRDPGHGPGRVGRVVLIGAGPPRGGRDSGSAGLVVLLVLAPLAPMAAVTLAYREWADPAGEISLATPSAGLKLVALRALAVSLAAVPLASSSWSPSTRGPGTCPCGWAPPGSCRGWPWPPWSCSPAPPASTRSTSRSGSACLGRVRAGRGDRGRSLRPVLFLDLIATPAVQAAALAVLVAAALLTVVRRDAVTYRRLA